jgi:hypothetical protein
MLEQFEGPVEPHHCRGEPLVQLLLESATLFQGAVVFEFRWPAVYDLVDILNCGLEFVFETNQLSDVGEPIALRPLGIGRLGLPTRRYCQ